MTNVKSLLEMYVKMGGSLTDTYADIAGGVPVGQYSTISDAILACSKKYSSGGGSLPADFPAEGSANANKFLGFDNSGDYAALDAPSGAEKFVVTLTEENDTWTADKTIAEIVAADEAGKIVVCKVPSSGGGVPYELPITTAVDVAGEAYISIFTGVIMSARGNGNDSATVYGSYAEGQTIWLVTTTPIPISTTAPLIVTLTAGQTEGQFVGDKTYKEVYDAFNANTTVTFKGNISGVSLVFSALNVAFTGSNYSVSFVAGTTIASSQGAENDYIALNIGG